MPQPDWPHIYDGDREFLKRVSLHVTALDLDGRPQSLRVFKQKSSASLLKRRGLFAAMSAQHEFIEITGDVFDFPLDSDFIEWGGYLFVLRLRQFETLTNIRDVTLARASDAINQIETVENLSIQGAENLVAHLQNNRQFARKLAAASHNGTLGKLTAEALRNQVERLGLNLNILVGEDGLVEIKFDATEKAQLQSFVELVTDVYLKSEATDMTYKTGYKEPYIRRKAP